MSKLRMIVVEWSEYGGHRAFEAERGTEQEVIEQRLGEELHEMHRMLRAGELDMSFDDVYNDGQTDGWPAFCLSAHDIELPSGWTWFSWDFDTQRMNRCGTGKPPSKLGKFDHRYVERR